MSKSDGRCKECGAILALVEGGIGAYLAQRRLLRMQEGGKRRERSGWCAMIARPEKVPQAAWEADTQRLEIRPVRFRRKQGVHPLPGSCG